MNTTAAVEIGNPFPGLRPFREGEEHLFFGRESQVDTMIDKLAGTYFLAVVGTSGSGKSSLVNCGLRPALHRGLMAKAGTSWRMAQFRPGGEPLKAMTRALATDGGLYSGYQGAIPLEEIVDTQLRLSKRGLIDTFRKARLPERANVLVVVDQFEELFRYRMLGPSAAGDGRDRSQEAVAFVNLLLEAKAQANFPIYIVLTMRSDFLGDCAEFPGLPEAINEGQYLVPRLTREERKAAIAGPVGVGGGEISPVLLTRLVNDVGDNPDQLSILQHALNRTWARWQHEGRGGGPLDLPHYEAIGTMARALDQHAEKAFGELETERQKKICKKTFKALTDKGTDPRGIRRPTKLKTLCALADASPAEVAEVIEVFRKPSRSFLMPPLPDPLEPDTVIDISHESLMRVWERLKTWADEEAQSARLYRRLSETAALHAKNEEGLWRDPQLQLTLLWREKEKPTEAWAGLYGGGFVPAMSFLAESEAQRDQEVREKEERQKWELEQAQALAAEQRHRAEEQARATRRFRLVAEGAFLCALIATLAFVFGKLQKEVALVAQGSAEEASKAALAAARAAFVKTGEAETEKQAAERARKTAEQEARRADREANRNLSHELAEASISNLEPDPGLSLLLALHALSVTYNVDRSSDKEAEEDLQQVVQATGRSSSGHGNEVVSVAFSSDGSRLATASSDRTAKIWDATSGEQLHTLRGRTSKVMGVAFSPDGKRVATTSADGTTTMWDAGSGEELFNLPGHGTEASAVAFSHDGTRLATAGQDGTVKVWDAGSGKDLVTLAGHTGMVCAVVFSQDGQRLATASADKTAKIWDISGREISGKELLTLSGHTDRVSGVAFNFDRTRLATSSWDKTAKVWDAESGNELLTLTGHIDRVSGVAFSPDRGRLATSGWDKTAKVWDAKSGNELLTLAGHSDHVNAVAFSSGGKLATGSTDRTARIWDATSGQPLLILSGYSISGSVLVFSPDGERLATATRDGRVSIWDARSSLELLTLRGQGTAVRIASFSADGRRLVTAGFDRTIRLWDLDRGREVTPVRPGHGTVVALNADGSRLATADGKTVIISDSISGQDPLTIEHSEGVCAAAFSPNGERLVTGKEDGTAEVWDAASGEDLHRLSGHRSRVCAVVFSRDGKRVASGSADKTARVWDAKNGTLLQSFSGHTDSVTAVAFSSRDRNQLATASNDGTVKIWDISSGRLVLNLAGKTREVTRSLAFSLDGAHLSTATDTSVRVYPLDARELVQMALSQIIDTWAPAECDDYLHMKRGCPKSMIDALGKIIEGNSLARAGDLDVAILSFKEAQQLDRTLKIDSLKQARVLKAEGLVVKARNLAMVGNVDGAVSTFRGAQDLNPALHFDPVVVTGKLAAQLFVDQGKTKASAGDADGAASSFARAKELDPSLSLDPQKEARTLAVQALTSRAKALAVNGDADGAASSFARAKELDPSLSLDPQKEAKTLAVQALAGRAKALAVNGDVEGAVPLLRKARELDPTLELTEAKVKQLAASARIARGRQLARQSKVTEAVAAYAQAQDLDPELKISAADWNELCWCGSASGHADAARVEVKEACDKAVELSKGDFRFRDSRGVNRAMNNDFEGAIEDFRDLIERIDSSSLPNRSDLKKQRQRWVDKLSARQDPFTPDDMKQLLSQ